MDQISNKSSGGDRPGHVVKKRTPEQQALKNREMHEQTKAFAVILEIIVIFAIPAILVSLLYDWLGFERWILYGALFFAFILSWSITLRRVKQLKERLDTIRKQREAIEEIDMTPIEGPGDED